MLAADLDVTDTVRNQVLPMQFAMLSGAMHTDDPVPSISTRSSHLKALLWGFFWAPWATAAGYFGVGLRPQGFGVSLGSRFRWIFDLV